MERAVIMVCHQWLCRRGQERSAEVRLSILSADSTKEITQEKNIIGLNMLKPKGIENWFFSGSRTALFFGVNSSFYYGLCSFVHHKGLSGQNKPFKCLQIVIQDSNKVE